VIALDFDALIDGGTGYSGPPASALSVADRHALVERLACRDRAQQARGDVNVQSYRVGGVEIWHTRKSGILGATVTNFRLMPSVTTRACPRLISQNNLSEFTPKTCPHWMGALQRGETIPCRCLQTRP
jgi:hypothetical protein